VYQLGTRHVVSSWARFRHGAMSELSPLCAQKRTSLRPQLSILRQLPASPMMVFPVGDEHPLDMAVQRSQHADPGQHRWAAMFGDQ
jgi:hypothetical protein